MREVSGSRPLPITSVLKLKAAYDNAPRNKVFDDTDRRIDKNTSNVIALALQPKRVLTKEDKSGTAEEGTEVVPQGSPLGLTILNIYINTSIEFLNHGLEMRLGEQKIGKHQ